MPLFGERIVTRHPARGLNALTAIAGSVWALFTLRFVPLGPPRWMVGLVPSWMFLIVVSVWLFCPVLWLASWAFVVQRRRLHVAMGGIWFASVVISLELHTRSQQVALGIDSRYQRLSNPLIFSTIGLVLGLTLGALVVWLVRTFVVRVTEQTDPARLCWRCGYDVGISMPPTCPECGRSPAHARPRWNRLHRTAMLTQRFARRVAALIICVLLVLLLRVYVLEIRPVQALRRQLGAGSTVVYAELDPPQGLAGSGSLPMYDSAVGHVLHIRSGAAHGYLVAYNPRPRFGLPPMQISLVVPGNVYVAQTGSPYIVADLTPDQARSVIQSGVPPALLDALSRRADELNWVPVGSRGTREVVDPTPFFPIVHPEPAE